MLSFFIKILNWQKERWKVDEFATPLKLIWIFRKAILVAKTIFPVSLAQGLKLGPKINVMPSDKCGTQRSGVMEPGHKRMLSLALILCLSLGRVTPSCFGQDASWQTNVGINSMIIKDWIFSSKKAKPTVSQPSKNDPEKVMITWGNIIKNVK